MNDIHSEKKKNTFTIDLLSRPKVSQNWIPLLQRRQNCWKVLSGKWKSESSNKIIYLREPKVTTGENFAIIGSRKWNDFTLQVKYKILNDSIKPPEGGTIIYFLVKNKKNFYSLDFL